MSKEGLIEK
jgi:hypothetical protein